MLKFLIDPGDDGATTPFESVSKQWLQQRATKYGFLRRAVRRFLPGEALDEALVAAVDLARFNISSVLTHLGENVTDRTKRRR